MEKTTEMPSKYRHLEKMSTVELLNNINTEDATVAESIKQHLPQIGNLVNIIKERLLSGGRLFYIGAGTSGRLGVLDASECPPTFGVSSHLVIGIIAGGDKALRFGIENAEDSEQLGWADLNNYEPTQKDVVVGIAASGTTPYVLGALKQAQKMGIVTGSIVCNPNSPISAFADFPIEVVVGPEFITGSTRMKSGTAQKLILNMISTAAMIGIGRVDDNKMVNMQITNQKLIDRGTKMLMDRTGIEDYEKAKAMLIRYGSVQEALKITKQL
nr:N-acetylmuramic acid 6-phosphate etherase [Pedobacter sp. Hv1]